MKLIAAVFLGIVLSTSTAVSTRAQDSSEITGATWMSLSRDARLGFVAGYINGLQFMASKFGLNLAPTIRNKLTATDWNDRLYENLLKQPELRKQPVGDVLYNIIESATDAAGRKGGGAPGTGK